MPTAFATIDLHALKHNCQVIQAQCPQKEIFAVVKSDAYGHGLIPIAKTLQNQVSGFAVAHIDDAKRLRDHAIQSPIMLLTGFLDKESLKLAIALNCQIVCHSPHQLTILHQLKFDQPIKVWIKMVSDMHRLGFRVDQLPAVLKQLQSCGIREPYGYMTHLPTLDVDDVPHAIKQGEQFLQMIPRDYQGKITIANTAGVFKHGDWMMHHTDVIRPGRSLYGLSPFKNRSAADLGLRPVMSFSARIIAIVDLKPGESIGYGSAYQATEKERIAIVGVGYADGYPRTTKGVVWVNGQRCAIRGYVCMDLMAIVIPNDRSIAIGDVVQLWGDHLPIEEVAKILDRSALDILMPLASRVEKRLINIT